MPKSVDGGEFFEDFVGRFPSLINHQFHFVNIILINAVRRIYSAGNLIEIVACTAEQGNQITYPSIAILRRYAAILIVPACAIRLSIKARSSGVTRNFT